MYKNYDIIFVGIGLANSLIAFLLKKNNPNLNMLLIDSKKIFDNYKTWSFHDKDISIEQKKWIKPFIVYQWSKYSVYFPKYYRKIKSKYFTITSERLYRIIKKTFHNNLLLNSIVVKLKKNSVYLKNGNVLNTKIVIDGRGYQFDNSMKTKFQTFYGQEWILNKSHELLEPIIMDATIYQKCSYRFIYVLPFSSNSLLIENTDYTDKKIINISDAKQSIIDYANKNSWELKTLLREEKGVLPIILHGDIKNFWNKRSVPCSGLQAGLLHPTTGYSFSQAVQLAEKICNARCFNSDAIYIIIKEFAYQQWENNAFYRILNRMLFLSSPAEKRYKIIEYFYNLPDDLISNFYSGNLTFLEKIKIFLNMNPPIPILSALKAIFINY